jgi:hypothetical protein
MNCSILRCGLNRLIGIKTLLPTTPRPLNPAILHRLFGEPTTSTSFPFPPKSLQLFSSRTHRDGNLSLDLTGRLRLVGASGEVQLNFERRCAFELHDVPSVFLRGIASSVRPPLE